MSLLPTSHLQSLNGSQYDRNLPSAVLSTCLVSDDPRLVEGFTVVETEAAGREGNRESTAVSDTLSSRQGELPPTPHTCRMSLNQGQPIATLTHTQAMQGIQTSGQGEVAQRSGQQCPLGTRK